MAYSTMTTLVFAAAPETPTELSVTSVTWESVELVWIPGHGGGRHQIHVVAVAATNRQASDTDHIPVELTTNSSTLNVTGMRPLVLFLSVHIRLKSKCNCAETFRHIRILFRSRNLTVKVYIKPIYFHK